MIFVHEDDDFQHLLGIVARETGIPAALVEKDYWITHTLWALHETGLDIWFKGGTSLSKGFGLIQRFSEDPRRTFAELPSENALVFGAAAAALRTVLQLVCK